MKKYLKVIFVGACMAVLIAFVAGCSAPKENPSDGKESSDGNEDGTAVEFDGGDLLYAEGDMIVMLDGNATTGYEWTSAIEGSSVKNDVDQYLAEGETVNGAGENVVAGAGGVHVFGYKAEGSGDATITLKYARSWEESSDDKTVVIKATIENGKFKDVAVQ